MPSAPLPPSPADNEGAPRAWLGVAPSAFMGARLQDWASDDEPLLERGDRATAPLRPPVNAPTSDADVPGLGVADVAQRLSDPSIAPPGGPASSPGMVTRSRIISVGGAWRSSFPPPADGAELHGPASMPPPPSHEPPERDVADPAPRDGDTEVRPGHEDWREIDYDGDAPELEFRSLSVAEAIEILERPDSEPPPGPHEQALIDEDAPTSPSLAKLSVPDLGDLLPPSSEEALSDLEIEEVAAAEQNLAPPVSDSSVQSTPPLRRTPPSSPPGPPVAPSVPPPPPPPPSATPEPRDESSEGPAPSMYAEPPAEVRRKRRLWFEELFNDDYARTLPRPPAAYTEREVSFIGDSLGCEQGATILDLGCGTGTHAVALARRGFEVIGIDLSLAMLARASDEAAEQRQRINFVQGDVRELSFDSAFDGAYCWGTTFGYFDDAKNCEVLQKVHRALRRGGRFLLDVVNRDYVMSRSPSMAWFEGDGCVCMDEMHVNPITSRLHVKRTMMMDDGRQRETEYSIRIYALHELGKLMHDCGFRVAEASGDTSTPGVYFGSESPRILLLAEKR